MGKKDDYLYIYIILLYFNLYSKNELFVMELKLKFF